MQRFTLLIGCLLLGIVSINAQTLKGVCGTTHEFQTYNTEQYIANLKAAKEMRAESRNANTVYVPIQYHIITRNNGTGGALLKNVLAQHCHLNENFAGTNLQFYMDEAPTMIANEAIFENPTLTSSEFTMRQRRNREAINIWIVNSAGNGTIGLTLGFYTPTNDWVVIRSDQITDVNKTLAHEVGHFLSLRHTHFGWCNVPYDEAEHGNPVQDVSPGAVQGTPVGIVATELVDGSNCEVAGDFICDTPPDYNFSFTSNGGCVYTRETMDPNGDLVDPDETLIMSQYQDRCISNFTEMQGLVMEADIDRAARNFLRVNPFTPLATEITDTPELLSPIESVVTASFNRVELRWNPVEGADSYLVEVDRSASFSIDRLNFCATSTTFLLEDILDADRNYRWRVTPLNANYTCAGPSETGRFRTGVSTSVATIQTVDDWTIQPNPVEAATAITIDVDAKTAFTATINIFNLTGQIIQSYPATDFTAGNSKIQLPITDLIKGVYFVALENEEGILNKRLIVQ